MADSSPLPPSPDADPTSAPTGHRGRRSPRRTFLLAAGAATVMGAAGTLVGLRLGDGPAPVAVDPAPATAGPVASPPAATEPSATDPAPTGSPPPAGSSPAATEPPDAPPDVMTYTFDGNTGLEQFRYGVYHRNIGAQEHGVDPVVWGDNNAAHGGEWTGDHDRGCGSPDTQRALASTKRPDDGSNGWVPSVDFHVDELLYVCRDHLMTSMGDVDGYSILWFSPDRVFDSVSSVCFDVNLTDLGTRQWWKVGVVSEPLFDSTDGHTPGFLTSDVGASNLPSLVADGQLVASWSGGASAGHPGGLKIGTTTGTAGFDAGDDKATRHPACLSEHDGAVTFEVADRSMTTAGSFPECPCRIVFYDHNYTPTKSESGPPIGFTWHWDNIRITD